MDVRTYKEGTATQKMYQSHTVRQGYDWSNRRLISDRIGNLGILCEWSGI